MAQGTGSESSFIDFTVASAFERLAADIEACLTTWRSGKELRRALSRHLQQHEQGSSEEVLLVRRAQLRHRLPFRSEPYSLTLHVPPQQRQAGAEAEPRSPRQRASVAAAVAATASESAEAGAAALVAPAPAPTAAAGADLWDAPHRLQTWFGLGAFLLLTPDSYSGRVLEAEEEHTLLSAAAVALSHAGCPWPLLLPVHDAVRDGYRGVAVVQPATGAQGWAAAGQTVKFETDSLHSSRLPEGLLQLDQLLLLLAKQLAAAGAPAAAAACRAAVAAEVEPLPASIAAEAAAARAGGTKPQQGGTLCVAVAVRHCYALPSPGEEQDGSSAWGEDAVGGSGSGEWDKHAPWRPWAAQADPVGCLELDVVWRFPSAAAALQSAAAAGELLGEEVASASLAPGHAAEWRLLALSDSYERDTGHRGFVLRPVDKQRRFLRLQSLLGRRAQRVLSSTADVAPAALPGDASFYSMLLQLLESCKWAARAPALGSLASADWWPQQGAYLPPAPPEWVLREALRDIFQLPVLPVWPGSASASVAWPVGTDGQHGCLGKAAPLGSLISRFTLHALALGSPRAVAELWSCFVSTLRLNYWEQLQPLPRMHLEQQQRQQKPQQPRAGRGKGGSTNKHSSSGGSGGNGSGHSGSDPSSSSRPEPPNLQMCLLHQKLQLLDLCIHLQAQRQQAQQAGGQEQQQQQQQQDGGQSSEGAVDWEASWGEGEEGKQQGQQGSQAALEWEASWGDGDNSEGREQPHSPSSSSSSYHSARAGSEASLSPLGERAQQRRQRQQQQVAAEQPHSNGDASTGRLADAEARGAVGVLPGATLHLHPSRPVWIPAVQEPPVHTEDTLAESQAALQSLPAADQDAAVLRSQLQGRLLSSDMQAFKAANPGACLLDFVRWHSPKDCRQGESGTWELSGRMAAKGNTWQQLWDAATPVPAAQQRPLFDPLLQGERVLHFLETLPPPALFAQLLALGFSVASQLLLAAGPAATLPAVQRQLECLVAAAGPELQHGVAAVLGSEDSDAEAAAPAPAGEQEAGSRSAGPSASLSPATSPNGKPHSRGDGRLPQRQPSWVRAMLGSGMSSDSFRRLLLLLGSAEQVVVAAHSLLLRLDQQQSGQQQQGQGQPQSSDDDEQQEQQQPDAGPSWAPSPFAAQAADGLVAAALGEAQQVPQAAAVRLPATSWADAEALLTERPEWETDGSASVSSSAGSSAGEEGWPDPFQREWLLTCGSRGAEAVAAAAAAAVAAGEAQPPPCKPSSPGGSSGGWLAPWEPSVAAGHRLFARALPSEVRIATALAPENAC